MQLTRKQVLELSAALRRLDTFKLTGKTRIQVANRIRRVTEAVEDIQTAQKGLFTQYGLTGQTKDVNGQQLPVDDPAKTRDHNLEWASQLSEAEDYTIGKFLIADLDLTSNNLAIGTLMQLLPAISDVPTHEMRKTKLRWGDIVGVAQSLARADSADAPIKLPYARKLALAQLLGRLSVLIDELEVKRQKMITERGLGKYKRNSAGYWESADDAASLKAYADLWLAHLQTEVEIDVPTLSSADLDLDTNPIPGSVLADLLLILTDPVE
jgi:hypothetical protein